MNRVISYVRNSKTDFIDIANYVLDKIFKFSNINLDIVENDNLLKKLSIGSVEFSALLQKCPVPNKYVLMVRSGALTDIILCHELWHLKQYQGGKLNISSDYKKVIYNGIEYDTTSSYIARPWENEAFSMQNKLLKEYKKYKKCLKI